MDYIWNIIHIIIMIWHHVCAYVGIIWHYICPYVDNVKTNLTGNDKLIITSSLLLAYITYFLSHENQEASKLQHISVPLSAIPDDERPKFLGALYCTIVAYPVQAHWLRRRFSQALSIPFHLVRYSYFAGVQYLILWIHPVKIHPVYLSYRFLQQQVSLHILAIVTIVAIAITLLYGGLPGYALIVTVISIILLYHFVFILVLLFSQRRVEGVFKMAILRFQESDVSDTTSKRIRELRELYSEPHIILSDLRKILNELRGLRADSRSSGE